MHVDKLDIHKEIKEKASNLSKNLDAIPPPPTRHNKSQCLRLITKVALGKQPKEKTTKG